MTAEKVLENKLRRMALRQGLRLEKSRRRDPHAVDFGGFMLVDVETNALVAGGSPVAYSMSAQEVQAWLASDKSVRHGQH